MSSIRRASSAVRRPAHGQLLVVEDDEAMRAVMVEILAAHGYHSIAVADGEQALAHLAHVDAHVDLVLLDGMLPGRSGWEVCEEIKQRHPRLPVVMVTARSEPEAIARTFAAGADDYLSKPFRSIELLARVDARLRLLRTERALRESEERYRVLYDQNALMLFSVGRDGRVLLVNDNGAEQLGYTSDELIDTSVIDIFHPEDRAAAAHNIAECFAQPDRVHQWEIRKLRRDGETVWVRETAKAFRSPDDSQIVSISCIDITERKLAIEALGHSEARFRSLIENAADLIVILSEEGTITYASPSTERVIGHTPDRLLGRNALEFVHLDDLPGVERAFTSLVQALGQSVTVEFRFRHADGGWRVLEITGTNLLHAPEIGGVVINARDLTERVHAESALKRYLTQVQGLAHAAVEVGVLRSPTEVVEAVVRWACTLIGTTRAELEIDIAGPGRLVTAVSDAGDGCEPAIVHDPFFAALVEQVRRTSQPLRLTQAEIAAHPGWARHNHRNDRPEPRGLIAVPLMGGNGQNLGVVCVFDKRDSDVGDVDQAVLVQLAQMASVAVENARLYEELEAAEERYRRFFEDDLTGDFISTPDGRLLDCNAAYVRIFGFASIEEALATPTQSVYPSEEIREALLARLRAERTLEAVEIELRRRDGKPVHVIENLIGSFDEHGELVQFKGYLFDITERKHLEQQFLQSQKMEVVGKLAGGIAHDFNNLLTVIRGNTALLLQEAPPGTDWRADLQEIDRAASRAGELTHQLLAFSRRQVLLPKVVDLNAVVTEMDKMLRRLIGEDIELITILDPDLDRVRVDPGQIQQVIMNLAVNARDAMPTGGTLVIETENGRLTEVDAERYDYVEPGAYVVLTVRDTGHGMSKELQARIFEPFFTTKEVGQGTGLGLSTVYGIVKQSGGYIWVQSEEGRGTLFQVYLPRTDTVRPISEPEVQDTTLPAGKGTVLLIEDEEAVRRLAQRVLEQRGYHVLAAASGEEALRRVREHHGPIQLLVSDVVMPKMSGPAVAEHVSRLYPDIRVIFISGYTDEAVMRHGSLRRDSFFLQKPFTPESLARLVHRALEE
jgi:two-component system, cell cycle sensor histidine kinase and response regulator CckA